MTGRSQNVSGQVCRDAVLMPLQLDKGTVSDVDIDFKLLNGHRFRLLSKWPSPLIHFFTSSPRDSFRLITGACTEDDMYK